jgi:N-acyl-D-aspartate/D-glutamate deacylase
MSLLIRNVSILGATSGKTERGDIFISGTRISALGNFPSVKAKTVIDGQGLYCAPGFIDVHSESDHYAGFLEHSSQEELLSQGITTAVIGQDGASLAPWTSRGLESLREITGTRAFNVDWSSFEEFMAIFRKQPWGIHFRTLAGYATLRRALGVADEKNMTKKDAVRLTQLFLQALNAGASGLSAGSRNFLNPACFFPEMKLLAPLLRSHSGIFAASVHAAGGFDDLFMSNLERLELPKVLLSDIPLDAESRPAFEKIIKSFETAGDEWFFEISPYEGVPLPIHHYLPAWAKKESLRKTSLDLKDEWLRKKIKTDMCSPDAEKTWVLYAAHHPELAGMSLKEILSMKAQEDVCELLLSLMRETGLRAVLIEAQADPSLVKEALRHPRSLIGSRGFSVGKRHKRGTREPLHNRSAFPRYLRAAEEAGVSLSDAVEKITKRPAELFGIPERGVMKEGYIADLVVFGPGDPAMDIRHVIIGGRVAWGEGLPSGERGGKIFTHLNLHDRARN